MPLPRPGNRNRNLIGGDSGSVAPSYEPEATYAEGYKPEYDLSTSTRGKVSSSIMTAYGDSEQSRRDGRQSPAFSKYGGQTAPTDTQRNESAYSFAESANVKGSKKFTKGQKDNPARAAAATYIFKMPKNSGKSNRASSAGMSMNATTLG